MTVDVLGLTHAATAPLNVTDHDEAALMLFFHRGISGKFTLLENILIDSGYTGGNFAQRMRNLVEAEVEVVKRC